MKGSTVEMYIQFSNDDFKQLKGCITWQIKDTPQFQQRSMLMHVVSRWFLYRKYMDTAGYYCICGLSLLYCGRCVHVQLAVTLEAMRKPHLPLSSLGTIRQHHRSHDRDSRLTDCGLAKDCHSLDTLRSIACSLETLYRNKYHLCDRLLCLCVCLASCCLSTEYISPAICCMFTCTGGKIKFRTFIQKISSTV